MNLWEVWRMSQAYHSRPSDLLQLRDGYTAFALDRAVYRFGSGLDNALELAGMAPQGSKKALTRTQIRNNRMKVLTEWLGLEPERRFRDPALKLAKR